MYSFHNPTSVCATCESDSFWVESLGCCDNYGNTRTCLGDELCDTGFLFCIIPLIGTSHCTYGTGASQLTPHYQPDTTSVFASSNQFAGLDIPFMLSGISTEWRVITVTLSDV